MGFLAGINIKGIFHDFFAGQGSFILQYGWIFFIILFLAVAFKLWMNYIQKRFLKEMECLVLAIDVPEDNEKTPKSMEQVIAGFFGIQKDPNIIEKYIKGYVQPVISLELVSIGSRVQFFVRTPKIFKDLVEAHIYAQYPTVEIKEVPDYTERVRKEDISSKYDLWGATLELIKEDALPIRTYKDFEEMAAEEKIIDPIAAITEVMANIKENEEIWLQLIIRPTLDMSWKEEGESIVKDRLGEKIEAKPNIIQKIFEGATGFITTLLKAPFGPVEGEGENKNEKVLPRAAFLSPGERFALEAIQRNISKLGFQTKIRFIYFGGKSIFNKARVAAFMGAMQQFSSLDLNGFKPAAAEKTGADYLFVAPRLKRKQHKVLRRYKMRYFATKGFVLNTEEIATIYHFPHISVKAATISRTKARRGGAPSELPVI